MGRGEGEKEQRYVTGLNVRMSQLKYYIQDRSREARVLVVARLYARRMGHTWQHGLTGERYVLDFDFEMPSPRSFLMGRHGSPSNLSDWTSTNSSMYGAIISKAECPFCDGGILLPKEIWRVCTYFGMVDNDGESNSSMNGHILVGLRVKDRNRLLYGSQLSLRVCLFVWLRSVNSRGSLGIMAVESRQGSEHMPVVRITGKNRCLKDLSHSFGAGWPTR
jgi:hypothetical protein